MKKKKKALLGAGLCFVTVSSAATLPYTNAINANHINKQSSSLTIDSKSADKICEVKIGRDYPALAYSYDNKVIDHSELKGILLAGNGDVYKNNTCLNKTQNWKTRLSEQQYAAAIGWDDAINGFRYYKTDYWHAVNSVNIPEWIASIQYHQLDHFSTNYKSDDNIYKNSFKQSGDEYLYQDKSTNGEIVNHSKSFAGVIRITTPYWRSEVPSDVNVPYNCYGYLGNDGAWAMTSAKQNNKFPSINNYLDTTNNPQYLGHFDYSDTFDGWSRYGYAFAILDNKFWFTNSGSSISNIELINTSGVSINEFKAIASDSNRLKDYLRISLSFKQYT